MGDRCVCCGAIIPEGRYVCPNCEGRTTIGRTCSDFKDKAVFVEVVPCEKCKRHLKCPIEEQLHRVKAKKRFCGLGERREGE